MNQRLRNLKSKVCVRFTPIAKFIVALATVFLMLDAVSEFQKLRRVPPPVCQTPTTPDTTGSAPKIRLCEFDLVISETDVQPNSSRIQNAPIALLIPVYRDGLTALINGELVGRVEVNQLRMPARLATVPAILPVQANNFRLGHNKLEIVVTGLAGRDPMLGPIYVGPSNLAVEQFRKLWFIAAIVPTLILGGQAALSFIFFTIWNRRRQETGFGWLALFLLLDTARGSPIIPAMGLESSSVSYWSLLVPFSSVAFLMFARTLAALKPTPHNWLFWLPPSIIASAALISSPTTATGILMPLGVMVVCCNLLVATAVLFNGWRRGIPEARFLFLCTALLAGFVVHDLMLSLQLIDGRMALARLGLLILLIAMITLMINRFTDAMSELDQTAKKMRQRATEIEAQLRIAYEKLSIQREGAVLAQERARLMRDLHDGLGGEMVAVLALAERGTAGFDEIAYHARAALSDMRLIVASLEDYDGDLTMAMGTWKERAEPQINAAGIKLNWLPANIGRDFHFGPRQTLEILRIMQESVANVIRHAKALTITVGCEVSEGHLVLTVEDDGVGLPTLVTNGRGLANMKGRANSLGGRIEIQSSNTGTAIRLYLSTPACT